MPCPVYATAETRRLAAHYPVGAWRVEKPCRPIRVCGFTVVAFREMHSLRAPAVGYRVSMMGKERGIDARLAYDDLELVLA